MRALRPSDRPVPRPAPRARTTAPAVAVAAAVLVLSGCGGDDETELVTQAVTRGEVREVVEAPGTVQPRNSATLTAPAAGTVATLAVADGQDVQAGQVLMTIDSPQARANLAQAEQADADAASSGATQSSAQSPKQLAAQQRAARADAQARFDAAEEQARAVPDPAAQAAALAAVQSSRTQYELLQSQTQALIDQVNAGLGNVDAAVASLSQTQRLQTRAAVAAAQRTVDALTVLAPISGKVSLAAAGGGGGSSAALPAGAADLLAQSGVTLPGAATGGGSAASAAGAPVLAQGAAVSAGSTLLSVVDASVLSLTANVDETDVLAVRPGTAADVAVDAVQGAAYKGTVTSVDPTATSAGSGAVTYTVRLSYDGGTGVDGAPAATPLPGMSAVVSLIVREAPDALRVPAAAILRAGAANGSPDSDAVWVVRAGAAHRQDVTVGVRGDDVVEVTAGLSQGQEIVAEGAGDVREGQQVS